jgi:hypothetical protein
VAIIASARRCPRSRDVQKSRSLDRDLVRTTDATIANLPSAPTGASHSHQAVERFGPARLSRPGLFAAAWQRGKRPSGEPTILPVAGRVQSLSMRSLVSITLVVVGTAAVVALGAVAARPPVLDCGSISVGPTALRPGTSSGAACLLRAYRQHCRPAVFELSIFGVDTIARDGFRLVMLDGACGVKVTTSFTVVPQKPRPQGSGECRTLAMRGSDVIAGGCTGSGLPSTISLTGRR